MQRLQDVLDRPIDLPGGTVIRVHCSLGHATATAEHEGIDVAQLLHRADTAMYRNKQTAGHKAIASHK